jgi:MoaA/NifB/PqqE/SkfB family radical SAM enzyme
MTTFKNDVSMTNPTVYCSAPWNGLTIREDGHVRTCCIGQTSLGNLNKVSIQEIENSEALKQIQQKMLSGQPDLDNCSGCVKLVSQSGLATLRNYYNTNYPDINHNLLKLKVVDVRWNNICNLGCLYCNEQFSSTWNNRLTHKIHTKPVKEYQDDLLLWILKHVDSIQELMLVGGEPLLMKQNYELLKHLPNDCRISIITNLSYDLKNNPAFLPLLEKSKETVVWNVSLENLENKFEYVRSGADWEQLKNNLVLLSEHWPQSISINMTYSMFSAFDIVDTIKQFHNFGIKKFNIFAVTQNRSIDVFNMPTAIKQLAYQQLKQAYCWHNDQIHPEDKQLYQWVGVEQLLSHLESSEEHPIGLEEFENKIKWYDQWSVNKFSELWPEVHDLARQYLI